MSNKSTFVFCEGVGYFVCGATKPSQCDFWNSKCRKKLVRVEGLMDVHASTFGAEKSFERFCCDNEKAVEDVKEKMLTNLG